MKKFSVLILLFSPLTVPVHASHYNGGEITWECLSNGKFIFRLNIYRDCLGVPTSFVNETISIYGNPLPSNSLSSISLRFDTALFNANNNGDMTQYCSSSYGTRPSCASAGSYGVYQFLPYVSDTIQLIGSPPPSGWLFVHDLACCTSPRHENVNVGQMYLTSRMYGIPGKSMDTCYSSSPSFPKFPEYEFCRFENVEFSSSANVSHTDSLRYSLSHTLGGLPPNLTPLAYKSGYSLNNVTPAVAANTNNVPLSIDPLSGLASFSVHSGNSTESYLSSIKIESWRAGRKLSEVNRVMPLFVKDCSITDTMPSGRSNTPPVIAAPFSNNGVSSFSTSVVAGTNLTIPISFSDSDSTGVGTQQLQQVTLIPMGNPFSRDLFNSRSCPSPNDTSCAVFNVPPSIDFNHVPASWSYKGRGSGFLNIFWQTDCNHLYDDGSAKTHYFVFKLFDDHCPMPKVVYKTVSVTVTPSPACNTITNVSDSKLEQDITMYPNPTKGELVMLGLNPTESYTIVVRNLKGQLIEHSAKRNQTELRFDIKGAQGVYFIQLTNEYGEQANFKVVKQ